MTRKKEIEKVKKFSIKKRSGGVREIYSPSATEKQELREILESHLSQHPVSASAHGFVRGRNIITNALPHLSCAVSISFDLSDFFPSCTLEKSNGLPAIVKEKCFIDGATQQGLPTSPAIANIIASKIDKAILKMLKKVSPDAVYTRYADDLTISLPSADYEKIAIIKQRVNEIVKRNGFALNQKKTHVQNAKSGRREVCGVMVENEIHISRYHRRKLRGMKHKLQFLTDEKERESLLRKIKGLEEFSLLKKPRSKKEKAAELTDKKQLGEAAKMAAQYKLKRPVCVKKSIQAEKLSENIRITNDPVYFYGMSAFTPGWTSCMSVHSSHNYRKGVAFFQRLPGCSLAILTGQKTRSVAGVERKEMISRCLVFSVRNGEKIYGKIYGHQTEKLKTALEKAGYLSARKTCGTVDGNVKKPCSLPYFDHGRAVGINIRTKKGIKKAWKMEI